MITQGSEASRLLGDLHRQHRLTFLSQLGAFGDEPQAIKVHVGAAGHRHQSAVSHVAIGHVLLQPSHGKCSSRFEDGARVFKHVLDGGTDRIGVDPHHAVNKLLGQGKGVLSHPADRNAVGEQAHLGQLNPFSLL